MVMPPIRRSVQFLAWLGVGWLGLLACSSDPSTPVGVTHPTMIEVRPADFLGERACADEPGAARRYVATLFDVTELVEGAGGAGGAGATEEATAGGATAEAPGKCGGFQLPSSQPVPCDTSVGFGFVVSGRHYCAEIDAYDTDQLEPRGSGTRQMVVGDPSDGEPPAVDAPKVQPAWDTICRQAMAASTVIVPVRDCEPLSGQPEAGAPGDLRVDTAQLLGDLSCGGEPGQVERLTVHLELDDPERMDASSLEAPCGDAVTFGAVPAGELVPLYVQAFEAASVKAFAGGECHAIARPGTTVTAPCAPLSQLGTLRVDLASQLATVGLACDSSISDLRVEIEGNEQQVLPPECLQPFDHDFATDHASAIVTVTPVDGDPRVLECESTIEPGRVVIAECTPI